MQTSVPFSTLVSPYRFLNNWEYAASHAGRELPHDGLYISHPVYNSTLPAGNPSRRQERPATLPEQFLQFGGVVAGENDVMVPDGVGQEVAGGLGGEPQDSLGAAEIGLGLAPEEIPLADETP